MRNDILTAIHGILAGYATDAVSVGRALTGAGKDWTWANTAPDHWVGWNTASCSVRTSRKQAARPAASTWTAASTTPCCSLGGHLGRAWELPNHAGLAVDLLAAWRHEILDGVFRSGASFRGYGNAGFESSTDLVGRNALLMQGSLRLTRGNDFFAQVDLVGNPARRPHPSTWV